MPKPRLSAEVLARRGATRATERASETLKVKKETPQVPDWLAQNPVAMVWWNALSKELASNGLLCSADQLVLATFCTTIADWLDAKERLLATTDKYSSAAKHLIRLEDLYFYRILKLSNQFGMSPISRLSLGKVQNQNPHDDLAVILGLKVRDV